MHTRVRSDMTPPVLQTGFRIFFLAAIVFAIITMTLWTLQLYFHWELRLDRIDRTQWHAHEMVFGYTTAVIAGFLLTAVQNWTGRKTLDDRRLFVLFLFWLIPRLLGLSPTFAYLPVILFGSGLFYLFLIMSLIKPIREAGNNKQWGIIGKLVLLGVLDMLFIGAAAGWVDVSWATPAALIAVYTVVGLILVMAQRVVPSFTRNAISNKDNVRDWRITGILSLVFFLLFVIADLMAWHTALLVSGLAVAAVNAVRLWGWHDREIWRKPLLWVLFTALLFITAGIALRGMARVLEIMPSLGLHAMTYGGIGLMTVGMMARVALGHTARDVFNPPDGLSLIFILLIVGAFVRAFVPILFMDYYFHLLLISQIFWIGAFVILLIYYFQPLIQPRIDGQYG